MISASRYHDISAGHRVCGHEGKCQHLHGHNYRIHFHCRAKALDSVGRVLDFEVIKEKLCQWLEDHWDHRMILYAQDPMAARLIKVDPTVLLVPFNPTAENMAQYLLDVVGPATLYRTGVELFGVEVEETRKCQASAWL